jgi:hypothetical protein
MVQQDQAAIMLAGPSLLSRSDATVTAFLVGFVKGLREFQASQRDHQITDPAVLEIVNRYTNIPTEVLAQARDSGAPPNARLDLDDLVRQQDFWAQEGLVQTKANLSSFVEHKYLDAAVAQLR